MTRAQLTKVQRLRAAVSAGTGLDLVLGAAALACLGALLAAFRRPVIGAEQLYGVVGLAAMAGVGYAIYQAHAGGPAASVPAAIATPATASADRVPRPLAAATPAPARPQPGDARLCRPGDDEGDAWCGAGDAAIDPADRDADAAGSAGPPGLHRGRGHMLGFPFGDARAHRTQHPPQEDPGD